MHPRAHTEQIRGCETLSVLVLVRTTFGAPGRGAGCTSTRFIVSVELVVVIFAHGAEEGPGWPGCCRCCCWIVRAAHSGSLRDGSGWRPARSAAPAAGRRAAGRSCCCWRCRRRCGRTAAVGRCRWCDGRNLRAPSVATAKRVAFARRGPGGSSRFRWCSPRRLRFAGGSAAALGCEDPYGGAGHGRWHAPVPSGSGLA